MENEVQDIGKECDKIDGIAYHPNKLTEYHVMNAKVKSFILCIQSGKQTRRKGQKNY